LQRNTQFFVENRYLWVVGPICAWGVFTMFRNSVIRFWRNWVLPDLALFLFCLLLLVIVWGAAFLQVERDRQATIEVVMHDGDKFSRAFEEHVRQVLKTHDQYLLLMKAEYERAQAVTPALRSILTLMAQDPLAIQLALVDSHGTMIISLLPYSGNVDFSQMPHFQAHVAANTQHLFIGRPADGRVSGISSIPLSRSLNNPDGSFAGIAYISLNPEYFTKFYQDMNFNAYYAVRVIGLDGFIRASNVKDETGADFSRAIIFGKIADNPSGFFYSPGTYFGVPRLMSYRVMPDYPLLVQVGASEEALYPMQQRRATYLSSAGVVSLFILFYTGRLVARSRRQRQTEIQLRLSEEKYFKAFHVSPDSININRTADGKYIEINEGFTRMTGYSWDDVAGKTSVELGILHDRDRLLAGLAKRGEVENLETRFRRKDGSVLFGLISAKRINMAGEDCLLSIVRDITERKQAEISLEKSNEELTAAHETLIATEEELRTQYAEVLHMNQELAAYEAERTALLSAIPDLMLLFDKDGVHLDYAKPADFEACFEPDQVVIGRNVADILPAKYAQSFIRYIRKTLATKKTQFYEYSRMIHGVRRHWEVRFSRVSDTKVLAMSRDTTAIRQSEEQVKFLSMHDALTAAYNRAYFEEELLRLQAREHKSIGMFVCDVDGLKLINDTLGHRQGDELLKTVAAILSTGIEQPDFTARIGGDEFAVVLFEPEQHRMEDLEKQYKSAVAEYNERNPHLPLSLSMGWAVDLDGIHIDRVFKEADNNMYRQKMHQSQSVHGAIVQTMMKALEARDHITEGHADRLGELMEKMGQKLQFSQGVIADLRLFAKFHDIGKVGIPDSILKKPGKLSPEEVVVMQRHCEIGFRIARSSPDLEPIAEWILKHQEHWDGNGYPLELAGKEIPIECRVLGIIDAYDAMTSDRPYRKAMSPRDAIAEIRRCSGTQFDPVLAEQFIEMLESQQIQPNAAG